MEPDQDAVRVSPELAQAVTRLGHLRRQLKELETEETLLRDEIVSIIGDWPKERFPLRVGSFEVRLAERRGRLDVSASRTILDEQGLMASLPTEPVVQDVEALRHLGRSMTSLAMPDASRAELVQRYQRAIGWQPVLAVESISTLYEEARLSRDLYLACFKDGKPVVPTLTVR